MSEILKREKILPKKKRYSNFQSFRAAAIFEELWTKTASFAGGLILGVKNSDYLCTSKIIFL